MYKHLDRDLVAKGGPVALHDDSLTGTSEDPNTHSSARVSGQIVYQSPKCKPIYHNTNDSIFILKK